MIRRTNTRRPPDRMSTSDEEDDQADDEGPCHGFSTATSTEPEDQEQREPEHQAPDFEIEEEDRPMFNRILAIIQGKLPPDSATRTAAKEDIIDTGPSTGGRAIQDTNPNPSGRTNPREATTNEDATSRNQLG